MKTHEFKIENQELVGQRIDKLLPEFNNEWSRSQIQDLIKEDLVTVNEKVIKSNYKVKLNDLIIVTDTSGLLMVAKNDIAHRGLVEQLMDKSVKRKYTALVHGNIPHDYGTIDAPIGRNEKDRQSMDVVDNGKEAVTHFNVLEHFNDYTLIECQLETGRTHQIRVHMKYIGFPLVGDPKYGPRKTLDIGGQALHAGVIGFEHPVTHEYIERQAELPKEFETLLEDIRLRDA